MTLQLKRYSKRYEGKAGIAVAAHLEQEIMV